MYIYVCCVCLIVEATFEHVFLGWTFGWRGGALLGFFSSLTEVNDQVLHVEVPLTSLLKQPPSVCPLPAPSLLPRPSFISSLVGDLWP